MDGGQNGKATSRAADQIGGAHCQKSCLTLLSTLLLPVLNSATTTTRTAIYPDKTPLAKINLEI